MPADSTANVRSAPAFVDGRSRKFHFAATVRSWKPWLPWRTPWLASVQMYGTIAMTFSRSVTP